jgi:hypothetical protein
MLQKTKNLICANLLTSAVCLILLFILLLIKKIYIFGNDNSCDGWFYYGYALDPGNTVYKINNLNVIQYQFSRFLLWIPLFFSFKISQILSINNFFIIPQIIFVICFSFLLNKMILSLIKNKIYSFLLTVVITTSPLILHNSTNANLFIQPFVALIFGYILFYIFNKIYLIYKNKNNNLIIPIKYNYILFFVLFFSYFVTAYFFWSIFIFLFFFYLYLLKNKLSSIKEIFFPILIIFLISILFYFFIGFLLGINNKNIFQLLISQLNHSSSSLTNIVSLSPNLSRYSYPLNFETFLNQPFFITFSILVIYFFLLSFYNFFLKNNNKYEFLISYLFFFLPVIFFNLLLLFFSRSHMNDKSSIHLLVYFFFIFFYFIKYSETKNIILYKIYILIFILFFSLILQFILLPFQGNFFYNLLILLTLFSIFLYAFFRKFLFFSESIILLLFLFGSYYTATAWKKTDNLVSTRFVRESFDWFSKNNIRVDFLIFNEKDSSINFKKGISGSKYIALYRSLEGCGYISSIERNNIIDKKLLIDKNSNFKFLLVGFGSLDNANNFYHNEKYKITILNQKYSRDLDLIYYEIKLN